ncbi:hypothetical protein F4826_004786 [Rahnella inusitata]|nr:hypothetical protein [Rahnella inusitata]
MHQWNWHHFEDQTEPVEVDEHDAYSAATDTIVGEYITRDFWIGNAKKRTGFGYTIAFQRVPQLSLLTCVLGSDFQYKGKKLTLPASGGWVVNFNLSNAGLDFDQVQLTHQARRELFAEIACAVYDHYNVTKAGLYCWYAARPELLGLYDRALGFKVDAELKQKFIPETHNFNRLGDAGRGYAIITNYY